MDDYLENYNEEDHNMGGDELLFEEEEQKQNPIEEQNGQHVSTQNNQQTIQQQQQSAHNGNSSEQQEQRMDEQQDSNKQTKLKQFSDEMIRINILNFKANYAQKDNQMKAEKEVADIIQIEQGVKMQMEYYFSDTNLIHDKYLRCIIEKSPNGCVDIKTFLKFNRMNQILKPILQGRVSIHSNSTTTTTNQIKVDQRKGQKPSNNNNHQQQQQKYSKKDLINFVRDSLYQSIVLKVKKDSSKVKRLIPFNLEQAEKCSKERTLYVDFLPPKCSKATLLAIFDNFNITNINLPLQKNSEFCKGFAFIEFASVAEANQALQSKNSSIPKELILLAEKKIGQGSIRIITHAKWEEEKKVFKNVCSSNQSASQAQVGDKRKFSDDFNEIDLNVEHNALIKIVNIPVNVQKAEVMLAVRHLGFEFYCDYLESEKKDSDEGSNQLHSYLNEEIQQKQSQQQQIQIAQPNSHDSSIKNQQQDTNQTNKNPSLSDILSIGQAMVRFSNSQDKLQAVQRAQQQNNQRLQIEIRGKLCEIIPQIDGEEEAHYWNYVKYKKNEFRKFFYLKKLEKKQKHNEINKN